MSLSAACPSFLAILLAHPPSVGQADSAGLLREGEPDTLSASDLSPYIIARINSHSRKYSYRHRAIINGTPHLYYVLPGSYAETSALEETMAKTTTRKNQPGGEYRIRKYRPGDCEEVFELYRSLLVVHADPEDWFQWKFFDNPYVEEVPVFVVEHDGRVVGMRAALPLRFDVGGDPETGILTVASMIHEDHQRQGLFSWLVAEMYDYYAERAPVMSIGFPTAYSEDAILSSPELRSKLSIEHSVVSQYPRYVRIQRPETMARRKTETPVVHHAARFGGPVYRGYRRFRDARVSDADGVTVRRHQQVPAKQLATLASRNKPPWVHARRDEQFYEWRFTYPDFDYTTYTAHRNGSLVASVVAGTRTRGPTTATHVSDVLPLGANADRTPALANLLRAVVADATDSDLVMAAGSTMPSALLRQFGFFPDYSFPLAHVETQRTLLARPMTNDPIDTWTINGMELSDRSNWGLSFGTQEIA